MHDEYSSKIQCPANSFYDDRARLSEEILLLIIEIRTLLSLTAHGQTII